MNKSILLGFTLLFTLLTGCKNKLLFSKIPENIQVKEVKFDYLSTRSKIEIEGDKKISGVANFRIRKDSIIWISLSPGLGVEAARVIITQDSLTVMDKINKTFTTVYFQDASKKFDFNFTYKVIESLILGNLIYPYDKEKLKKHASFYSYNRTSGNYSFETFIGAKSMKLERLQITDTLSQSMISVNYDNFNLVENEILPFNIDFILKYKDELKSPATINIQVARAEIDEKPLRFPFNIPDKYEKN